MGSLAGAPDYGQPVIQDLLELIELTMANLRSFFEHMSYELDLAYPLSPTPSSAVTLAYLDVLLDARLIKSRTNVMALGEKPTTSAIMFMERYFAFLDFLVPRTQ